MLFPWYVERKHTIGQQWFDWEWNTNIYIYGVLFFLVVTIVVWCCRCDYSSNSATLVALFWEFLQRCRSCSSNPCCVWFPTNHNKASSTRFPSLPSQPIQPTCRSIVDHAGVIKIHTLITPYLWVYLVCEKWTVAKITSQIKYQIATTDNEYEVYI